MLESAVAIKARISFTLFRNAYADFPSFKVFSVHRPDCLKCLVVIAHFYKTKAFSFLRFTVSNYFYRNYFTKSFKRTFQYFFRRTKT